MSQRPKAVVLLSGGLDSATTLFVAKRERYDVRALIFDYGQRHAKEIRQAGRIARRAGVKATLVKVHLPWKGSSLLDRSLAVPKGRTFGEIRRGIPSTYVPSRNLLFLAYGLSFAESIGARRVYIGAHTQDASGYPDCRKEFLDAFRKVVCVGTREGLRGRLRIEAPLIDKSKREIVELAAALGVPFGSTWSCYQGEKDPCGRCDACRLRSRGFSEAGINDPLVRKTGKRIHGKG